MKIALLADIHGNHHALSCVLDAARKEECDRLLIAGDFVGYYYHPDKVFDLLDGWKCDAVKGNHDILIQGSMNSSEHLEKIGRAHV